MPGCPQAQGRSVMGSAAGEYSSNQGVQPISNSNFIIFLFYFCISCIIYSLSATLAALHLLFFLFQQENLKEKKNRHQKLSPTLLPNPAKTFIWAPKPTPSIPGEGMHQQMSRVKAREGK